MELENHRADQAYIQLLIETLAKKKEVLTFLKNLTQQQEDLISSENFEEAVFHETITLKEKHIQTLSELDDGFEKLYERVKAELMTNKVNYVTEIKALQQLITEITDLSVKLQALEKRNKSKLDLLLSRKRAKIKESRISGRTAVNYYKTMTQQQEVPSLFYDKKK